MLTFRPTELLGQILASGLLAHSTNKYEPKNFTYKMTA
jgi:hypothetical protein